RAVKDALPVPEIRLDERRPAEVLREPVLQIKGRDNPAEAGRVEGLVEVEPVERHPAAPARIEGLGKEDAVAGANHRLLIPRIRDAEARREPLLPGLFREFSAEARRTVIVAGKRQAAGTSTRAGVRADRIEEREAVKFLAERREDVPAQTV